MVQLKAFKAYRLQAPWANQVAALPYDVLSTPEATRIVKENPYSFLSVDKPEIYINKTGRESYLYAVAKLQMMLKKGIYQQDKKSLYIYELESKDAHQYGLVGLVSVIDYQTGKIKRHEKTRLDKEKDRTEHIFYCKAHTGPIFLIENTKINLGEQLIKYTSIEKPLIDVTFSDGVSHRIYQISYSKSIQELLNLVNDIPYLYIADGHHRAAAACRVAAAMPNDEEAQYFLGVIFPKEQLHICPYHRLIKDESGLSKQEILEKIALFFEVKEVSTSLYLPKEKHTFGMRYQKQWYRLNYKKELCEEKNIIKQLDVSILQDTILAPIFKITNPQCDKRLDFVPGSEQVEVLNQRADRDNSIAFSLYPTSVKELVDVADANGLMPPKSTWFEPKLRSGFFIHYFN